MREKRSRNRRILFLTVAVLIVLFLVIGECCQLVGLVQ
jgi:predicted nucleic acid-binding Zn ribbon protein